MGAHSFHVVTPHGSLYFSGGNSKVMVPVFSVGAATDCPNREVCTFSHQNVGNWKAGVCYAQRTEMLYPTVMNARRMNEKIIRALSREDTGRYAVKLADYMAKVCVKKQVKYVRINESSDIAEWNIEFLTYLVMRLGKHSIRAFGYSKSSQFLRETLDDAGMSIRESDVDFIAIDSIDQLPPGGRLCPGLGCGLTCIRCPKSLYKLYIVKH